MTANKRRSRSHDPMVGYKAIGLQDGRTFILKPLPMSRSGLLLDILARIINVLEMGGVSLVSQAEPSLVLSSLLTGIRRSFDDLLPAIVSVLPYCLYDGDGRLADLDKVDSFEVFRLSEAFVELNITPRLVTDFFEFCGRGSTIAQMIAQILTQRGLIPGTDSTTTGDL